MYLLFKFHKCELNSNNFTLHVKLSKILFYMPSLSLFVRLEDTIPSPTAGIRCICWTLGCLWISVLGTLFKSVITREAHSMLLCNSNLVHRLLCGRLYLKTHPI